MIYQANVAALDCNSFHPEQQAAPAKYSGRVEELDSLRGLAAMTVVFHHCLVVFSAPWALYQASHLPGNPLLAALGFSPLHLAWGGVEAVNVFFVLSGLVLAFPFLRNNPPRYGDFVMKRLVRIYIPYFVVMAGALFLMDALTPLGRPVASSWFQQYWGRHADGVTLRDYALMLGKPSQNFVNPVIWSLVHEVRIYLVFPILMWLVRSRKAWELLAAFFLFSLGAKFSLHVVGMAHWWSTVIDTCQYVFFFVAGAEMAKHRVYLIDIYHRASTSVRIGALAFSLLLLNARWELPPALRELSAICIWFGAISIVTLALASAGERSFLRWRPMVWLGQISYSLYLTHCLVLFSFLLLLHAYMPLALIVVFVPLVSLCVAAVVYRAVELPSLLLAKRISQPKSRGQRVSTACG